MLIKVNEAKDKTEFENKVAYLNAILIQEYINQLKVEQRIREEIKNEVIKRLQMN